MDLKNIPVKIINLDRRTDRWDNMKNVNFGFNSVERFSAYDGSKETEFKDGSILTKLSIKSGLKRYHEEINTKGSYACYKSHMNLLKELAESNHPYYIILEDDLILSKFSKDYSLYDFVSEKYKLIEESKRKFDIWLIGYVGLRDCEKTHNIKIKASKTFHEPELSICTLTDNIVNATSFVGTHCYLVSKEAALKIINNPEPISFHIDAFFSFLAQLGEINIIALTNKEDIISQGVFESDLNHNSGDVCNFSDNKLEKLTNKAIAKQVENASPVPLYIFIVILIIIIVILLISNYKDTQIKFFEVGNKRIYNQLN